MQEYQPFLYPPDYELAKIHQQCTSPGKVSRNNNTKCPCCNEVVREPLKNWMSRSLDHDFKNKGGAVVTYFWLVKLYGFICGLIMIVYSLYLIMVIHDVCPNQAQGKYPCQRFLGIFITTNRNLIDYLVADGQKQTKTRLLTLRTMTLVILLIGNFVALYISGRFKRRYPQPKDISKFSLIFKNVKVPVEDFALMLKDECPNLQIVEMFSVKKMEPFYRYYNLKIQTYFSLLIEQKQKNKKKLLSKLLSYQHLCQKYEKNFNEQSGRIIVVFNKEEHKIKFEQKYKKKGIQKFRHFIGIKNPEDLKIFCQQCPIPDEIIWNNLGEQQGQKIRSKVISFAYFLLLLGGSYLIMRFCLKIVYFQSIQAPWGMIISNLIMIMLVAMALTFRQLMNRLSEMRRPNTQTHRTGFIILTTVLFHIIYYVIIPTVYLVAIKDLDKNKILFIITNQTFNFLLVQFVLAYIDLVYCSWNKRLKKVEDSSKPIGCQKILHNNMQYPRFPIEFKLIILFKTFSFIILFAFESPLILMLCFALLVFLYWFDKFSVYNHYRMEIIDNKVQFKFLKIYSVFFSLYTFTIFCITQDYTPLQIYSACAFLTVLIMAQIFFVKDETFEDETIPLSTIQESNITDSYKKRYNNFKQEATDEKTDNNIKQFLMKTGDNSLRTDESLENKLI